MTLTALATLCSLAWANPSLPDIDTPNRTGRTAPNEAAVVVGLERYAFIPHVPHAARDAEAFRSFAQYTRGVAPDKIFFLNGASAQEIEAAVASAGKAVSGGIVWVYFAGHGAASASSGARILLGDDVRPDAASFESRAVTVDRLEQLASVNGNRAMMVLDTCYAGTGRAGEDLVKGKRFAVPDYARPANPNVAQWTAAGPNQLSGPLNAAQHGLFTYFAVGALRGWADGELDGKRDQSVTAAEAQAYVQRMLGSLQERSQTPSWNGAAQDWVLASGVKEKGPDLAVIQAAIAAEASGTADAPAPPVKRDWQRRAENVNVNVNIDRTGMSEIRYLNALKEERLKIEKHIRKEAAKEWKETWKFASSNYSPEVSRMLEVFIDKYAEAAVTVEERREPIVLAQSELAADWHDRIDSGWKSWSPKEVRRYQSPTRSTAKVKRSSGGGGGGGVVSASIFTMASLGPYGAFDGNYRGSVTDGPLQRKLGLDVRSEVPLLVRFGDAFVLGVGAAATTSNARASSTNFIGFADGYLGIADDKISLLSYGGYHPAGSASAEAWHAGARVMMQGARTKWWALYGFSLEFEQVRDVFDPGNVIIEVQGDRYTKHSNVAMLRFGVGFGAGGHAR